MIGLVSTFISAIIMPSAILFVVLNGGSVYVVIIGQIIMDNENVLES